MRRSTLLTFLCLALFAVLAVPSQADAQLLKKVKDAAQNAVEDEAANQTARLLREAIRCAVNDPVCAEQAEEDGKPVIYTDQDGDVITDDDGNPITDRNKAASQAGVPPGDAAAGPPPAPTASTTYDFEPGERVIFFDDYTDDNLGDFPRHLTFVRGSWEVVEWQGRRLLQNTGPRHAAFQVELPEELPEQFTIEFDVFFPHGNQVMMMATSPPTADGGNWTSLEGNVFKVGSDQKAGLAAGHGGKGVESTIPAPSVREGLVPFRIMADGDHVKVFVGEQRVANVPNADIRRSGTLYFENTYFADLDYPMFVGPIRVAAGGRDLYDALEAEGRVAVRNILFDTGLATIRPESAEVLSTIGSMLQEHPELKLMIEGHTDSEGEFDFNMQLSADRAAAVKGYLVDNFGVDSERLRTIGLGQTQPVDTNDTAEGRQQNRRVELVKI